MINIYEFEEKKESLLEDKINELNSDLNELLVFKKEIDGGFLKSKKYYAKVIKKSEVKKFIKDFFNEIAKYMNISISSEVNEKDNAINILLVTDNNAVLIGKDGRTLKSLQLLIRQAIKAQTGFNVYLNMDIGGYKKNKLKKFDFEIKRIAKEVLHSKVDVKLDPMNSYERRIVHSIVSEFDELSTISEGEDPERFITIKYNK